MKLSMISLANGEAFNDVTVATGEWEDFQKHPEYVNEFLKLTFNDDVPNRYVRYSQIASYAIAE